MGAVRFSIDPGLVRQLVTELPLEVFVETGTYEGASVRAVLPFFSEVHTIELSDELFARAEETFAEEPQVHVHHGRSQEVLEKLAPKLKSRKTLFWLDAHWSDEPGSVGQDEPCPLLEELALIGSLRRDSVVMIDDARLFLAPPPAPIDPDQWPDLEQVMTALSSLSRSHEPMVIDDVIVHFPSKAKGAVREYARENAADWFAELGRAHETNVRLERLESQIEAIPQQVIPAQIGKLELGLGKRLEAVQRALAELSAGSGAIQEAIGQIRPAETREEIRALDGRLGEIGSQLESLQQGTAELSEAARATQEAVGEVRSAGRDEVEAVRQRVEAVSAQLEDVQEQRPQIEQIQRQLQALQEQETQIPLMREQLRAAQQLQQSQIEEVQKQRTHIEEVQRLLQEVQKDRAHIEEVQRLLTVLSEPVEARQRRRERRRERMGKLLGAPARAIGVALYPAARVLSPAWARVRRAASASRQHWRVRLSRLRPEPKLGELEHHPPMELEIPKRYLNSKPPADPPTISIVTPSYNQASFLERTIRSVVEQEYPRLEYIVQDGDSSDHTREVLERHAQQLEHWEMQPDDGQANAINLGFSRSTGEVMAYLNSDDLLLPGSLRYVGRYFEAHADVDVVYGHRVLIDEQDREIGRWILPRHRDSILSWADYVPQETLFWRRSAWEASGGRLDEEFRFALDWDLLLRLRDAGARMVRVPRFLGAFRVHRAQKTTADLTVAGAEEMAMIRSREHRREVSDEDVSRELRAYLRRHVALHKLYRAGLIRY